MIFEHPKNWFIFFDSYFIIPLVVSLYVTYSSPLFGNPTVESTSRVLSSLIESALYWPITLVWGWTLNCPYNAPSNAISLLYPESKLSL